MYILDYKIDKGLSPIKNVLVRSFTEHLIENEGLNITNKRKETIDQSVACFLLNSYHIHKRGRDKLGITLDKTNYSTSNIVNGRDTKRKVSYKYTLLLFEFLQLNSYIDLHKGGVTKYGVSKGKWGVLETENSFVVIQDKLKSLYDDYNIDLGVNIKDNVVIVRVKGKSVPFRMTTAVKIAKQITDRYNRLSVNHIVESGRGVHDVQIHKVYNDKTFEVNGRSYMSSEGIQHLTKEERLGLIVGGNETVVFDYSSFEPSIAYSIVGEVMPDDPYDITLEGYDKEILRSIAKKCLLIMLNMKSRSYESLRQACNGVLQEEFDIGKLHSQGKIPERIDVTTICDLLDQKNYLIRGFFYGEAKTDTAYMGSLICDYITDYFSQRKILVLSVFDEFIIEEQYEDELLKVMKNAYEFVCGTEKNCRITKEK